MQKSTESSGQQPPQAAEGAAEAGSVQAGSATPSQINHLGIAVRDLDEALLVWRDGLGLAVQQVVDLPDRGLRVAFLPCGEAMIELLAPLHDHSEISKFLAERGPGLHHVCLQTADLAGSTRRAEAAGLRMLGEGPKLGAEGYPVRFAHPKSTAGALVELLEVEQKMPAA